MHVHPAHLAALAAALAACSFSAAPSGAPFRCDAERDCPDGMTCGAGGYCESPSDAGPQPDAGAEAAACGTTDALRESFDDAERFAWFWSNDSSMGATAAAEDGRLVLRLPVGGEAYAGRTALRSYPFRDGSGLTLRVVEPPGGTGRLALYLIFPGGTRGQLVAGQGLIRVLWNTGDGWSTLGEQSYQAAAASRWRVREAGGGLRFEIAGEEGDWSDLATMPELPAEPVEVSFFLNDDLERDAAISAAVDDLNQESDTTPCAASTLTDDFGDGTAGLEWATWTYGDCTFAEEEGQLRFRNMGDAYSDCGYRSRAGYDMTGDAVEVELVPPEPQSAGLNFGLRIADGYGYFVRLRPGALVQEAWVYAPGGDQRVGTEEYSPDTTRFWRLEHAATSGELRFLYSADGTDWNLLGATQGTDLDNVRLSLYGSEFAPSDGVVAFDRLNLVNQ